MKRFHGVSFLLGFALAGLCAGVALDVINTGWISTIENHKKLERTLMDRIELRDQQDTANAGVKTLLIDRTNPLHTAWVIPGHVVPHSSDGHLGMVYAYLQMNSSVTDVSEWYAAYRDEAPNILSVVDTAFPPVPVLPAANDPAANAQRLLEILKAAKGR